MPTYEYVCTECATPLEVVASFSDPPLTQCPACGGRLRKVFGNVGVVFKGSGFYRNDSRGKKTGSAPASSGGSQDKSSPDKVASKSGSGSASESSSGGSASSDSSGTAAKAPAAKPAASAS